MENKVDGFGDLLTLKNSINPSPEIVQKGFEYGYLVYKNFKCRSVIKDGKPTGEYHVAPIGIKASDLVRILESGLDDSVADLIDESLGLEYPIVLSVESTMINESLDDLFKQIDRQIGG